MQLMQSDFTTDEFALFLCSCGNLWRMQFQYLKIISYSRKAAHFSRHISATPL